MSLPQGLTWHWDLQLSRQLRRLQMDVQWQPLHLRQPEDQGPRRHQRTLPVQIHLQHNSQELPQPFLSLVLLADSLQTPAGLVEILRAPSVTASVVAIRCLVSVVVCLVELVLAWDGFNGNGAGGFGQQTRFGAQGGSAFGGIGGQGARGNFGPTGNNGFTGGQPGFGGAAPAGGNAFGSGGFNRRERQRRR
ncbi:unnamed protein product [Peronospora effusa]|nr:unnamed protein product [Peronospora effusa]